MISRSLTGCALALSALLGLSLWEGCGPPPKPVPPSFNLYGYKGMAVVPFTNQTQDPGLAPALSGEMTTQIAGLNALPIVEADRVQAFLKQRNASVADLANDDALRKDLGAKFRCDLLLMGTATAYTEVLKDEAPTRQTGENGQGQWGFTTRRKVTASGTYRILDVTTGNLLWSDKNDGYSWKNTWNPLPIPGDITVPGQIGQFINLADLVRHRATHDGDREPLVVNQNDPKVLLYPKSQIFGELRQNAVYENIHGMTDEFRGHNGWVPNGAAAP